MAEAADRNDAEESPEKISGGHLVAKALKNEGVDLRGGGHHRHL
jgi:hypothetical protein